MLTLRRTLSALAACCVVAAFAPHTLLGQRAPTHVISINPFLPLTGSFQGEFETRTRDNLSVAVSASYLDTGDDESFTNADVKLRLYPSEKALQGFGLAAGVGVGSQKQRESLFCIAVVGIGGCGSLPRRVTGPTFSVEMQYQWLLGSKQSTAVTVGGGAKRYFIDDKPYGLDGFTQFMPTLRLTVGYAFR